MPSRSWVGSLGGQYTDDDRISPEEDNNSQVQSSSAFHRRGETERSMVTRSQSRAIHDRELGGSHHQGTSRRAQDPAADQRMRQDIRDMTEGTRALNLTQERHSNTSSTAIDAWYDRALDQYYIH